MKKALIITYYWPPSGGPGVQRVLKFAKYLPHFGWEPIILTVKNGTYPAIDESLEKDIPKNCKVFKTKALEPNFLYRKFTGMKKGDKIPVANLAQKNISRKKKMANWVRLNLFIPDAKIGWIPYAVKQGKKIIEQEEPDLIFSSSPPPSVHLIAKRLAKWSGIKWVADFRDPWTDIYHYDGVKRSAYAKNKDLRLERKVVENADKMIVVSKHIGKYLLKQNLHQTATVITNGYDESDFEPIKNNSFGEFFTVSYAGKINNQQNPENFWKALSSLKNTHKDFSKKLRIHLMGNITGDVLESIYALNLEENLIQPGYVSHPEMLVQLSYSEILLLLIPNTKKNLSIVPGKIFEYLAIQKFIIGIGPEKGDAADILNETKSGKMFEFGDFENVKNTILKQFHNWENGVSHTFSQEVFAKYSRKALTKQLVTQFNEIL